jgi:hypothetical protein
VYSGALVHYYDSTTGTKTHLLDFYQPASDNWNDPALPAGSSWTDPYSNVTIRAVSATADRLTVEVTYGPAPCTPANPTVTLAPSNQSAQPGATANYTVSVKNNDSAGCETGSFTLASTVPATWPAGVLTPASLSIVPGQTGATNLAVAVPGAATAGTYPVSATATKGGLSGTGSANCTVTTPITVAVAATPASVLAGQTVTITATVKSGQNPVPGASVTFTMTKPGGAKANKKVTTGTGGTAVWNYVAGKRDPAGTYSVSATAKYGGVTATSGAASFSVTVP